MVDGSDILSNGQSVTTIPTVTAVMAISTRANAFLTGIFVAEMDFATTQVMGERTFELTNRYAPADGGSIKTRAGGYTGFTHTGLICFSAMQA
jgi:hypothetical protein